MAIRKADAGTGPVFWDEGEASALAITDETVTDSGFAYAADVIDRDFQCFLREPNDMVGEAIEKGDR